MSNWIVSHFPITLSIAAAGAGVASLIEHAHDAQTPEPIAWLISGSVALGLLATILASQSLVDAERLPGVFRKLDLAMAVAALVALAIGFLRPAPWIFVLAIGALQTVLWLLVVRWFIRADAWPPPEFEPVE